MCYCERRPKEQSNALKRSIFGHSKKVQGGGDTVGAGGTFCLEPELLEHFMRSGSHSRNWDVFDGAVVRATQNFPVAHPYQGCGSRVGAQATCLKLNQSRHGILFTCEAPAELNIFPDSRYSEPKLPEILDQVTTGRYTI